MLIYRFRHRFWIVVAIIVADAVIGAYVGDKLIRWELDQLKEAW